MFRKCGVLSVLREPNRLVPGVAVFEPHISLNSTAYTRARLWS